MVRRALGNMTQKKESEKEHTSRGRLGGGSVSSKIREKDKEGEGTGKRVKNLDVCRETIRETKECRGVGIGVGATGGGGKEII